LRQAYKNPAARLAPVQASFRRACTLRLLEIRLQAIQLLAYLDTAISELEAGQWEGVAGALLYPSRPASLEPWCASRRQQMNKRSC